MSTRCCSTDSCCEGREPCPTPEECVQHDDCFLLVERIAARVLVFVTSAAIIAAAAAALYTIMGPAP